ncbi:2Fe-2S iron-sulfur cluster-binding protein [Luminiphilus syltensis]|uniref:2Fe-2S iron-sulfur cluster-binding protein n=1 Tax=Luminiphilus syltensis TaxID=1341119 RepID=UPI000316C26B|nr:2Fe-2S iron-sulfur cluster-binding protein [Luminiphilus syltensis]
MPTIKFINADGSEIEAEGEVGSSVMLAAINNGVDGIVAECGGSCACATCHCYIDDAWTAVAGEPNDMEKSMIECALEPNDNSRLACQITITDAMDGMVVNVPEAQY